MKFSQICNHCVMDRSIPDIDFDVDGVCNYCRAARVRISSELYAGSSHQGKIDSLLAKIKSDGKGRPYDCIIGVSGGVDSTYVAYLVKRKFGLRPLAIHFDNGWNSDLAVQNIECLLKKLDIDLHTHVVDWEEFRDLQLSFLKSSVANSEIPTDHAIIALLYRMAARYRVRYVLHGGNLSTESIMPATWMENSLDLRFLRSIHRRFGTQGLSTYPILGLSRLAYYTFFKRIRYIGILNYLDYNKERAMQFLEAEFGWRRYKGKHFESIYTRWFQGYLLPKKFGMDKRRPHFSSLIVSGQMTRMDALEELKEEPYDLRLVREDIQYVCRKFGLSQDEFDAIMNSPVKGLKDYPNSSWVLTGLAPLVARAKAIATGRR